MPLTAGTRLGPYEVVSALGAGGMGEVYRARDPRLGRDVAIKVLPTSFAGDPDRLRRFELEARAIAALSHPNIMTVFDVGRAGDISYFVTELLEGETLRVRLDAGPLSVPRAVEVMTQLAAGLAAAHARGILHRDLKPENVFLTRDGLVKILDFGLAKIAPPVGVSAQDETHTIDSAPGRVLGTLGYMAPEQVRGRDVDGRVDICSFGAIFHEALTGRRLFHRGSPADTISAVLNDHPPDLTVAASGVSNQLDRLIRRCLEKDPDERFQSARDLRFAIDALSDSGLNRPAQTAADAAAPSIAVLPFTDMSPQQDQAYFCEGMAEEIINALTRVEGLRVAARTSTFQFKAAGHDIRQIAGALRVRTVLEGSVRTAGTRLRVTAQLVDVAAGRTIWSDRFDGGMEDVFDIQDRIASAIVSALKVRLLGSTIVQAPERYTTNLDAYHFYLKGRHHRFTTYNLREALAAFQQAVALDSSYALAHAALAYTVFALGVYGVIPPAVARARATAAIDHALAIDGGLIPALVTRAYMAALYDHQWTVAEQGFRDALAISPMDADAHAFFGIVWSSLQRRADALEEFGRAKELEPYSAWTLAVTGLGRALMNDHADAVREAERALEIRPDSVLAQDVFGCSAVFLGRVDEGIALLERAAAGSGRPSWALCELGHVYQMAGRYDDAARLVAELDERRCKEYVSPGWRAALVSGLGRVDEALDLIDEAIAAGDPVTSFLWSPWFVPLRAHPRFGGMLRRLGLPPTS